MPMYSYYKKMNNFLKSYQKSYMNRNITESVLRKYWQNKFNNVIDNINNIDTRELSNIHHFFDFKVSNNLYTFEYTFEYHDNSNESIWCCKAITNKFVEISAGGDINSDKFICTLSFNLDKYNVYDDFKRIEGIEYDEVKELFEFYKIR